MFITKQLLVIDFAFPPQKKNSDGSGPNIAVISHDDDGEEGRDQQHQPEPWFRGYEAQEDWRAEAARRADLRF